MLVSTAWLAGHLDDPDLVIVDLRWREDGSGRERFDVGHVPGAVFLDWASDIVDPEAPFAFMLAPPERCARAMARCRIGDDSPIVAYADDHGSGAFRLRWACRVYGHEDVRILDGGLDRWVAEGRPLSADPPTQRAPSSPWRARSGEPLVASAEDVQAAAGRRDVAVLDSRPAEQYRGAFVWFEAGQVPAGPDGIAHTPRGDLRAGHVPWAASVPAADLYHEDHTMKSPEELRELFARAGAGEISRAITYCGVGVSASALLFALERSGLRDVRLYDASWEEWGRDPARPVIRE